MAKKTRLTEATRTRAVRALLVHACLERAHALRLAEAALADRVLRERFNPVDLTQIETLPEGWLPMSRGVGNINAGGWRIYLYFADPALTLERAREEAMVSWNVAEYGPGHLAHHYHERPLPCIAAERHNALSYDVQDPGLIEAIQAHVQAKRAWEEESTLIWRQIQSVVKGFKTLEDMLDKIPELKALDPELLKAAPETTALVPDVERLMCSIAHVRGEKRDGCCDGVREADLAPAAEAA